MKKIKLTCPQCQKSWSFVGDNPEGHTEVVCPSCLKVAYDQFTAELRHVQFALPLGYIEVPSELSALKLGEWEFMVRLTAYRLGTPLEQLLGAPQRILQ